VINNAVYHLKLIQPEAEEKVKEYLGMIEKEIHTAEKIITDLLDFARIKTVDRESAVAADLIHHVLERHPRRSRSRSCFNSLPACRRSMPFRTRWSRCLKTW
jgi:signal transduction histidine kinase